MSSVSAKYELNSPLIGVFSSRCVKRKSDCRNQFGELKDKWGYSVANGNAGEFSFFPWTV
jgi:hypothetical protein